MSLSVSASAMGAFQTYANNNAQNIANVNSEGYSPTRTTMVENAGGGVDARSEKVQSGVQGASQVDLAVEMTDQVVMQGGFEANAAAVRTQDEMLGTVLDLKA